MLALVPLSRRPSKGKLPPPPPQSDSPGYPNRHVSESTTPGACPCHPQNFSRNLTKTFDNGNVLQYNHHMILEDGTIRHRRRDINQPGHAHGLTFSCFAGYKLLSKPRACNWFIEALASGCEKHQVQLWAYVLMPEHVHLIVLPERDEYKMASFRKSVKQSVSRRAMSYLERHSPEWLERLTVRRPGGAVERHFWQEGGGYDRNILSSRALLNTILYFHANPVRRGLAANPTDWEWSSARHYEGYEDVKLKMDRTLPWL